MQWRKFMLIFLWLLYVSECRDFHSDPTSDSAQVIRGQIKSSRDELRRSEGVGGYEDGSLLELHRMKNVLEEEGIERTSQVGQTLLHFINVFQLYLPRSDLVNPQCQRDLRAIYVAMLHLKDLAKNGTIWPIKLVDSWGKFSDGVLEGNVKELGFFHECLDIHHPQHNYAGSSLLHRLRQSNPRRGTIENGETEGWKTYGAAAESNDYDANFEGQYCLLTYAPKSSERASTGDMKGSPHGLGMPSLSILSSPDLLALMAYATCMPSTCTTDELWASVNSELAESGVQVASVDCQTKNQHLVLNTPETVGIVLLVLVCILLVVATLCDQILYLPRWSHHRNGPLKYLLTFSLTQNLTKLFHLDTGKSNQVISSIHGIRFLSITWVILCHQYGFSANAAQNIGELPKMTLSTLFQIILNGTFSVDTFFLMSGILVTISLLSHLTRVGRFSPLIYYLHRILRLLPPMVLTLMLLATLSELVVSGPLSGYLQPFLRACRHNWWMDLTLTTNLILPHLPDMGPQYQGGTCLGHTWYVDVDTQLFIFMPLVLLPLYFYPRKGRVWLGVMTFISCLIPAIIVGVEHTWPTILLKNDPSASYMYKVYMMPWCRAGPYLVGAWYGYIIHTASHKPSLATLKPWQVLCGWVLAVGAALSVLLGIAPYNYVNVPDTVPDFPRALAILYGGFARAVWAAAVGWVVLACHWGYGGPVDWFLSHPIWQPFSRLTYTMYLTSVPIQLVVSVSIVRLSYYSHIVKVQETCGIIFLTFFAALFVSLASEAPVLRLEKLLLRPTAPLPVREESESEESRPLHDPTQDDDDDNTSHSSQGEASSGGVKYQSLRNEV
ncbi:hypothetical protein Pmani_031262 [Petrolisthes manimaculis]|uniref:Nose resistant-to-fluoxetine protein N-terminal domain-containing protein n=1 Tax=Petrolisthes manimaculis TaxID=1843537 RepID=A0AAE1NU81_9EUCA|nr:hypothetical protein Pmani_031262 [Petrolisthes manimaculis]